MIIQCDKCATKFRLDESRVTGNGVKVRCTKCQNVFIVTPPPPADEVQLEEVFGITTNPTSQPERPRQAAPRPRPEDKVNLKFDFGKRNTMEPPAGEDTPGPKEEAAGAPFAPSVPSDESPEEKKEDKKINFDNIDFSFARGPEEDSSKAQEEESAAPAEPPAPPAEEKRPAKEPVDFDFSFDEEEKEKPTSAQAEQEPALTLLKNEPFAGGEKEEEESFKVSIGTPEEKKAPENFQDVLSHSIEEGGGEPPFDEGTDEEVETEAPKSRSRFALVAVLIVIVFGGAAVYFTGVIDMLARSLMPPAQVEKTVEIETVNGFFTENKNFGRFFVIEAKIRNLTDKPQEIKAATGILYDGRGERLASRSVSPGRVLTPDDLKNLSSEEIQRAFKDPTGGSVPPKGVVPVMVPFTEVPEGLAECGIDVVR